MSSDIRPGTVLAGKYRIEKILGQGAMGVVVAARHLNLDEDVAIKFLLPSALESRETLARFEREAQAAAKIRSEHVARVRDVGRLESGAPYMVMEHLSGMDLKEYLAETGPLPVEEAIHYLLQASEALAEAHALGIVHRDLKPANMFRIIRTDGTPSVKILDFGISKLQNSDAGMTQTSTMMGSPYYMSPEQMTSSKDVDARTDVWALGIILHQLLTGDVPFGGESIGEVCAKVITTEAPRLSEFRDDIPPGLQEAIDRALLKDRNKRLSNVAEFAQSLVPFGQEGDVLSADRVSRVLGFIPPPTVRISGEHLKVAQAQLEGAQTLGGAANTQREQVLPTKSAATWIWGPIALISLVALGVYFRTTLEDDTSSDASAAGPLPALGTAEKFDSAEDRSKVPRAADPSTETLSEGINKLNASTTRPPLPSSAPLSPSPPKAPRRDPNAETAKPSASAASLPSEDPEPPIAPRAEPDAPPAPSPETPPQAETAPPAAPDPSEFYRDRR